MLWRSYIQLLKCCGVAIYSC